MSGEEMTDEELMTLFEAARWAPSYYNLQPWIFIYAKRNTDNWKKFMDLLVPLNQEWCETASVLVAVISYKYFNLNGNKAEIPTHSYDAGTAWMSIALEGTASGFVVHGIGGFDYDKAYKVLKVNKETHCIDAMIAIGKRPTKESRKMNEEYSLRIPVEKFVSEGVFSKSFRKSHQMRIDD
jgi:nitroreductase